MAWLNNLEGVEPALEPLDTVQKALDDFTASLLCNDTAIQVVISKLNGSEVDEMMLDEGQLLSHVKDRSMDQGTLNFYFVNKFLLKFRDAIVPQDANKLRISSKSFKRLVHHCRITPSFVHAICRHFLPHGRAHQEPSVDPGSDTYNYWYLLPVRVQVRCTDKRRGHVASASKNNQMDPFNYLHLPDVEVDIRGSCIAIHASHDVSTGHATFAIFNLLDGRWAKVVEEPKTRIAEALSHSAQTGCDLSPYFMHLVYFTSISRWWTNAMSSVNDQLIAYEKTLQEEMDSQHDSTEYYSSLSRALHSIAAHLHRYRSELNSLEASIVFVANQLTELRHLHEKTDHANRRTVHGLEQTASQIRATNDLGLELEKKLSNILALLFNRMQIANTQALNTVLRAIQTDTQTSQRLSEEMQKDSLSMKTACDALSTIARNLSSHKLTYLQIAVVTMFFLPGATFAALFSMPFIESNAWLASISRVWLWFIFTVPTTTFVFLFYWYYKRQGEKRATKVTKGEEVSEDSP